MRFVVGGWLVLVMVVAVGCHGAEEPEDPLPPLTNSALEALCLGALDAGLVVSPYEPVEPEMRSKKTCTVGMFDKDWVVGKEDRIRFELSVSTRPLDGMSSGFEQPSLDANCTPFDAQSDRFREIRELEGVEYCLVGEGPIGAEDADERPDYTRTLSLGAVERDVEFHVTLLALPAPIDEYPYDVERPVDELDPEVAGLMEEVMDATFVAMVAGLRA